jgi:redox-sensing transcriptional repressor
VSEQGEFASSARRRDIPEASVARLPVYLRALSSLAETGCSTVSSEGLAAAAGVNSAKVRKDLSHLGSYGTRGVGRLRRLRHPRLPDRRAGRQRPGAGR